MSYNKEQGTDTSDFLSEYSFEPGIMVGGNVPEEFGYFPITSKINEESEYPICPFCKKSLTYRGTAVFCDDRMYSCCGCKKDFIRCYDREWYVKSR